MPVQLGLRLPSRKRFFRRGQELARFAVLKQPARLFPKKAFALGSAAMGRGWAINVRPQLTLPFSAGRYGSSDSLSRCLTQIFHSLM